MGSMINPAVKWLIEKSYSYLKKFLLHEVDIDESEQLKKAFELIEYLWNKKINKGGLK